MQDGLLGAESGVRLARHGLEIARLDEWGKGTSASCEDEKKGQICVGLSSPAWQWYVSRKTIGKCPSRKEVFGGRIVCGHVPISS